MQTPFPSTASGLARIVFLVSARVERRLARGAAAAVLLACCCLARTASADDTTAATPPIAPDASAAPSSSEEREQQAAQLFEDAELRYQAGDVAGAHQLMRSAYDLSGRFELLFNLGQLERELKHCPEARRHYEAYVARAPESPRRDQARRFQLELERECPEHPAVRPVLPTPTPPIPREQGFTPLQIAGWSSLGATLVAGVAATYFALEAARHEDRFEARIRTAQASDGQSRGFSQSDKDLEADGQRAADWARGLTVGAVGLAAVGISLLVIDGGHPRADATASSFSVGWSRGAARAEYSASF